MNEAEYLNKTVWCRLGPSRIHGIGVFAIRDIPKGQRITDYRYANVKGHGDYSWREKNGVRFYEMREGDFALILPEIRQLILDRMLWDETQTILKFVSPNHDQFLQSFMNHADRPNTDDCVALTNIRKGEEVTEDFKLLFTTPHHLTKAHHAFLYGATGQRTKTPR